jgi:hypothetical protein
MLTMADRAAAFQEAFPDYEAAWPRVVHEGQRAERHAVLYATWLTGANYKRSRASLDGTFPPRFLPYLLALFPDIRLKDVLHAFSGALLPGPYTRLDINPERQPDVIGTVYDAPQLLHRQFKLIIADPPYSKRDAEERYGTAGVQQLRATSALAECLAPRGFLAWLDTSWPMATKEKLITVGRFYLQGSQQHRVRVCTVFQRAPRRMEILPSEETWVDNGEVKRRYVGAHCVDLDWPWLTPEREPKLMVPA